MKRSVPNSLPILHIKSENKFGNDNYVVNSRQFGNGYVIGTSGLYPGVNSRSVIGTSNGIPFNTSPEDFIEWLKKNDVPFIDNSEQA